MNNIANKVIVITGASSGLGEATALHLAKKAQRWCYQHVDKTI